MVQRILFQVKACYPLYSKTVKEGKYRWERFFTYVTDDGISKSYFSYFVGIVILWVGYSQYKKRKAKKNTAKS